MMVFLTKYHHEIINFPYVFWITRMKKFNALFLFNHYASHQIFHAIPYAFELSIKYHETVNVTIACVTREQEKVIDDIAEFYPGQSCKILQLSSYALYDLIDPIVSKFSFKRKNMILKKNISFFKKFDIIVSPELHFSKLKTKYGISYPKLCFTQHGAGDREKAIDPRNKLFDLLLLPGQKLADRFSRLDILKKDGYSIVGYPKFEVVEFLHKENTHLFKNDNPTVLYNPHFSQDVASWGKWGIRILDFFRENKNYNLIFAPHVVLFKRTIKHGAKIPDEYYHCDNILIDVDSPSLIDMTYTIAADIYLGDVSSQVCEFILTPRPCIFLNAHHIDWKNDPSYEFWNLGQVIDHPDDLATALAEASEKQQSLYEKNQKDMFNYIFYSEKGSSAAQRGADAIAKYMMTAKDIRSET